MYRRHDPTPETEGSQPFSGYVRDLSCCSLLAALHLYPMPCGIIGALLGVSLRSTKGLGSTNNNPIHAYPALLRSLLRSASSRRVSVDLGSTRLVCFVEMFLKVVAGTDSRGCPSHLTPHAAGISSCILVVSFAHHCVAPRNFALSELTD